MLYRLNEYDLLPNNALWAEVHMAKTTAEDRAAIKKRDPNEQIGPWRLFVRDHGLIVCNVARWDNQDGLFDNWVDDDDEQTQSVAISLDDD